ncbi:hypothetical protein GCM10010284_19820 [Streptomyces rubiginosohelvolus]|uniref:Secreted protein n=1 Tax=Streptomyces rubiginosohelvolus TaxID=67362 RepID=A0ABQ3BGZ8_9ACTN|nr:hypothetical protein GCM10010284_19820 [Streptomyces rubiginosohelvolus]GGZ43569.1 hypothetical protein GCM10010328_17180 [Streptomyces pluricolorescens]
MRRGGVVSAVVIRASVPGAAADRAGGPGPAITPGSKDAGTLSPHRAPGDSGPECGGADPPRPVTFPEPAAGLRCDFRDVPVKR